MPSPLRRRTLAAVALAAAAATALAAPASAYSMDGRAEFIVDGDTTKIDLYGDGTATPAVVRNAGIQAMERGQCHAAEATSAMSALVHGKVVRTSAASASSTNDGRLLRFLDIATPSGWVDVQQRLIEQGHVLWYPLAPEQGRSATYHLAQSRARAAGRNLWDRDFCGYGPSQTASLRLFVHYDANGVDTQNLNDEYVKIANYSHVPVDLSGWWLRSPSPDSYRFPSGTVLKARSEVTLHVGSGTSSPAAGRFYWGHTWPRFSNPAVASSPGGAAYLFDPQGDLRTSTTYPCVYRCSDPTQGRVRMTVDATSSDEKVVLESTGGSVDLSYRTLERTGSTHTFPRDTWLTEGRRMVVHMGTGTNTAYERYWQRTDTPVLPNSGGTMELRSSETVRLACAAWGDQRC